MEYESRRKAILDEMAAVREAEIRQQRAEQRAREEGVAEDVRQARGDDEGEMWRTLYNFARLIWTISATR